MPLRLITNALITKDFNGLPIVFRGDGYFNMTKAAQQFGKRLDEFMSNKGTQEYLDALANTGNYRDKEIIKVQRGNGLLPQVGTYGHPKLAVFFARWLSPAFAVWCDGIIDDLLHGDSQTTVVIGGNPLPLNYLLSSSQ